MLGCLVKFKTFLNVQVDINHCSLARKLERLKIWNKTDIRVHWNEYMVSLDGRSLVNIGNFTSVLTTLKESGCQKVLNTRFQVPVG